MSFFFPFIEKVLCCDLVGLGSILIHLSEKREEEGLYWETRFTSAFILLLLFRIPCKIKCPITPYRCIDLSIYDLDGS